MADAPAQAETECRGQGRPPAHESGDRHHVVDLEGVDEAEQKRGAERQQPAHALPLMPSIRLTSLSHAAGCGCKLGSNDLTEVLRHLPEVVDPNVLVDAAIRDVAAVDRFAADRSVDAMVAFVT